MFDDAIKKAARSAAKWLSVQVKNNQKLNPLPYPFFSTAINNQVNWGKTQRGVILDFEELAQATRSELLKAGIHVMSESGRENSGSEALKALVENGVSADFVCNGCEGRNVDKKECPLYNVFVHSSRAGSACTFMCAFYHDSPNCQMPVTDENIKSGGFYR